MSIAPCAPCLLDLSNFFSAPFGSPNEDKTHRSPFPGSMEIEHRDRPRFLIFGRCRRNSATPFFCVVLVAGGDGSRHLRDLAAWRAY